MSVPNKSEDKPKTTEENKPTPEDVKPSPDNPVQTSEDSVQKTAVPASKKPIEKPVSQPTDQDSTHPEQSPEKSDQPSDKTSQVDGVKSPQEQPVQPAKENKPKTKSVRSKGTRSKNAPKTAEASHDAPKASDASTKASKDAPQADASASPEKEAKPEAATKDVQEAAKDTQEEAAETDEDKSADSDANNSDEEQANEPAATYVLRILSGPHEGAEVTLQEQAIMLGKSDACDVILVDETLQDQHASFACKDGTVTCTPAEGASVSVNGTAITAATPVQAFQPIICGATLLAVGPNNVVWPAISTAAKDSTASEDPSGTPSEDMAQELKEQEDSDDTNQVEQKSWHLILWIILGFGFILGTYGWITYRNYTRTPAIEKVVFPIMALRQSIEKVLERHNVPQEFVKINVSGHRFVLQCYVVTREDQEKLEEELHHLPYVNFQSIHIYVQQRLVSKAQDIVSPYQTLQVVPGNQLDGISIKGFLYSIEDLPAIKRRMLTEIPGLNSIETVLSNSDEIYNLASNLLSKYELKGLLRVQVIRTGIMITGHIQASDEVRWKEAQKTLKKTFDGICKVLSYVATVTPSAVKKIFFPSPITTVSIPNDQLPWVDLQNGDRYFEGSILPSGYKIQSISKKGIRLQKNDDVTLFALSEL
ncbi:MAG: type III secretion system inner membrane ring subunit SctD [Opitutales bacterium]|nr:type III secretion system inner membrane ring subunit SctD [Opitutales bacterium]